MTGIYLFVIMIAATAIFAYPGDNPILPVPTKCPSVDPLNYTVHLAHKTDCTKFYKCFNGKKYKMSCPDNWRGGKLHFNKVLQVCDYPERAGCNDNSTCPAGSDGKAFPHECSCSKYYVCHNGDLVLKKCPKGKHWSTKKQQCLRAAIAGCIQPNKTI
ncbi:hypothetical protein KPH14_007443 [Odynerus spinipes]|uniref:Chitin-binding type-2 domain-containing protein n=1 Tax=Odynerus spinipes TaxID=1348599 RepID=A0AAD9VIR1_9HYME|nr:hypothetical protein KPH14_007443 [Odynerus spinipes]